jgi:chromosome segregation protein
MLKALELSGFKSFADRTRFEFPQGISVVVGPNGSGKSNIVDAVKWVLGSQSAKSLRGKEMIDVIFNGCASRGPLGTAEVTLTLDNADGRLPIEAKDVYVTRRVYRSGEGEYLLNRQPCRLKDIRELLASTGMTTEAYCIIEQGKVDALLQSSPKDRRGIFEEAAGISQFKSKKQTAARRMERVEQNLLRLSDIVDEVESRLRSVRAQAGKARKYRECAERLQQLRTEVGLFDWRSLTKQLTSRETQLAELQRRAGDQSAALAQAESQSQELERQAESSVAEQRELDAAASATREEIAALQATAQNQRTRRVELEQDIAHIAEQLAAMESRDGDGGDEFRNITEQLQAAETELAAAELQRQEHETRATEASVELEAARSAVEQVRFKHADATREAAALRTQLTSLEVQLSASRNISAACRVRLTEFTEQAELLAAELAASESAEAECAAQAESHQASLRNAEHRLGDIRRELARTDKQHRHLEAALTRTRERIAVLTELEERLEGLTGGVQDVLRMAQDDRRGLLGEMRGVVADLFHVDVDSAPLVEMALGERAQYVVMSGVVGMLECLESEPLRVAGRVGFLSLDGREVLTALDHVDLSAEPGVMGRADQFVESGADIAPLTRRLLGRTWLVDRLSTAYRLSQTTGRGLDFVTAGGELLAADGTLIVGPRQAATGILSRRSELRACHEQVTEVERQLNHHATLHARLDAERAQQEANVAAFVAAYTTEAGRLAECREKTAESRVRIERIDEERTRLENEVRQAEEQIVAINAQLDAQREKQAAVATSATQWETELKGSCAALPRLQRQHSDLQNAATYAGIAVAKCEQRVEMLSCQALQLQRSEQQREVALKETRQQLVARTTSFDELEAAALSTDQSLKELHEAKDRHAAQLAAHMTATDALRKQRAEITEGVREIRQQLTAIQAQQHKVEVTVARVRHERQTLCERMHEDYGIDLAAEASVAASLRDADATSQGSELKNSAEPTLFHASLGETRRQSDREAVEREIADLRNQINNIGAINLEALDELEQLEVRFETLSTQYRDLVEAKESLERIIQRINVDSRQLFVATLETIRGHFQELFRRMFGGGEADIVVDEADDVLECGIEIVAKPPGKEACSISLLSGGEKTLTCVALLLAVFRSKPSPFCVLDEVDAALDEANIGRFIGVLREFLSFTQFVVVTHSKRTMAGADTLYGVTMEESGVSKRVSVRFEDVSEDGHISLNALRRAA